MDTNCCTVLKDDEDFWDTHQTMVNGKIWCPVKSIVEKAKADVKAKYGNKKRHRQ